VFHKVLARDCSFQARICGSWPGEYNFTTCCRGGMQGRREASAKDWAVTKLLEGIGHLFQGTPNVLLISIGLALAWRWGTRFALAGLAS